jgi:hypothetical protein
VFPPVPRVVPPVSRNTINRYKGGPLCQPAPTHRYPTRSQTRTKLASPHANHVATISGPLFLLPTSLSQHVANSVLDPITGQSLEYRQLSQGPIKDKWIHGFAANEIGRLAQGIRTRMPTGTDTIHFIKREQVPSDRKVTYGRIVATIRPQKSETHRVRLTVGGNLIDYPGDVSTPTADMTTAKILFNSVISTPDVRFMCTDVKDFYLNTPMARYEYMRLPLRILPQEIMDQYELLPLVHNGWIYVEIRKGMYGLPQAGIITNQRLEKHLAKYGYKPTYLTPGLWRHESPPITFSLGVNNFGVKYVGDQHAWHLITALEHLYTVSSDWTGSLYCGLTLDLNYTNRTVDLSMPDYVATALHRFQHPPPSRRQHAPHQWTRPVYCARVQYAPEPDDKVLLPAADIKRVQQVVSTLLYYARAVGSTMIVALNAISAAQSKATENTAAAIVHLLDYATTHPDAILRYKRSDMVLHVHSDASYLSAPEARSRAGGHHFLSSRPTDPTKAPSQQPTNNGSVHAECSVLCNVMASAAEAEIGTLYINSQTAEVFRTTLIEMGHPQPPMPVQTNNSTAYGIVNSSFRQPCLRAIDMRFYWVRGRGRQNHFLVYWKPGRENLGDYFTKHHPPAHHQTMRSTYLQVAQAALRSTAHKPNSVRGCVDSILPHTTQAHNLAHNPLRKLLRLTHLLKHRLNSLT